MGKKTTASPDYAELKRRLGWEFNGMRLHEYYFENLGGKRALDAGGKLGKALAAEFGSVEKGETDFRAVAAMRGIGRPGRYRGPGGKKGLHPGGEQPAPRLRGRGVICTGVGAQRVCARVGGPAACRA